MHSPVDGRQAHGDGIRVHLAKLTSIQYPAYVHPPARGDQQEKYFVDHVLDITDL
jgi:hypothetical protein